MFEKEKNRTPDRDFTIPKIVIRPGEELEGLCMRCTPVIRILWIRQVIGGIEPHMNEGEKKKLRET